MIPFGLGIPFVTIDSHPKTRYFASDAGLGEFLVSADSASIANELDSHLVAMQEAWGEVCGALDRSRQEMARSLEVATVELGFGR
jgi:hypothetical protein